MGDVQNITMPGMWQRGFRLGRYLFYVLRRHSGARGWSFNLTLSTQYGFDACLTTGRTRWTIGAYPKAQD